MTDVLPDVLMGEPTGHVAGEAPVLRVLAPEDEGRWDAYVMANSAATFFHRAGWRHVIERAFGHRTWFFYTEQAGRITGVLPLAQIKSRLFGHSLASLPFCAYGGILADDEVARACLDAAARKLARELAVDALEYRNLAPLHSEWPTKSLYVTFRKVIDSDPEKNLTAIPRKQRAMVRKGIKAGLASEQDDGVDRFYRVYAESVRRHGTPVLAKHYFALLREIFGKDCSVLSVVKGDAVVSSVLSFHFRDEILPYYAGDLPAARDLAANDFKYWELMRRSAEAGYAVFDYGRSKVDTGPYHFKKNWGFTPQPLYYEYDLVRASRMPEVNPLNPKYRLFIAAWRRLPLPVANLLGPMLARSLG